MHSIVFVNFAIKAVEKERKNTNIQVYYLPIEKKSQESKDLKSKLIVWQKVGRASLKAQEQQQQQQHISSGRFIKKKTLNEQWQIE